MNYLPTLNTLNLEEENNGKDQILLILKYSQTSTIFTETTDKILTSDLLMYYCFIWTSAWLPDTHKCILCIKLGKNIDICLQMYSLAFTVKCDVLLTTL